MATFIDLNLTLDDSIRNMEYSECLNTAAAFTSEGALLWVKQNNKWIARIGITTFEVEDGLHFKCYSGNELLVKLRSPYEVGQLLEYIHQSNN
jgi:hypothetical protein